MQDLLQVAGVMLSQSETRLETVSRNVANIQTPGFKREVSFTELLEAQLNEQKIQNNIAEKLAFDFAQGSLNKTDRGMDFAISGQGFFGFRSGEDILLSRSGQFQYSEDGRITNLQGLSVLNAQGEELFLPRQDVEVLSDGTILSEDIPIEKFGVFDVSDEMQSLEHIDAGFYQASDVELKQSKSALIRQGMLENSNTELTTEMMDVMAAMQQAQSGARLVQTYDSLLGRAISTFEQG